MARTTFIVVDEEAFTSLLSSVMSRATNLIDEMPDDGLAGLTEDELTKALAKLLAASVLAVR